MNNIFCDNCGKIIQVIKTLDKDKTFGVCRSCHFVKELGSDLKTKEKEPTQKIIGKGIVKENKLIEKGFPHKCSKCGYGECDVYDLGASYSDEADVYLYKCKKCLHVDRQADGTSNK